MKYDAHNGVKDVTAVKLGAIAGNVTTVGEIIDTVGTESIEFVISAGTITDGTYTAKIEDGDDPALSDAADVSAELILGGLPVLTSADSDLTKRVGTIAKNRYVRLSIVSTAVSTGVDAMGAVALQGNLHHQPAA